MAENKDIHQNPEKTVFHTELASADDGDPQVTVAEVVAELEGKNTFLQERKARLNYSRSLFRTAD